MDVISGISQGVKGDLVPFLKESDVIAHLVVCLKVWYMIVCLKVYGLCLHACVHACIRTCMCECTYACACVFMCGLLCAYGIRHASAHGWCKATVSR